MAMEVWVHEPYEVMSRNPEAQELHDCSHSFAADVRERALRTCERQVAELIAAAPEADAAGLERLGLSVERFARNGKSGPKLVIKIQQGGKK